MILLNADKGLHVHGAFPSNTTNAALYMIVNWNWSILLKAIWHTEIYKQYMYCTIS